MQGRQKTSRRADRSDAQAGRTAQPHAKKTTIQTRREAQLEKSPSKKIPFASDTVAPWVEKIRDCFDDVTLRFAR
jgi:hypothetical protein